MRWYYLALAIFFAFMALAEAWEGKYTVAFYAFVFTIAFLIVGVIIKRMDQEDQDRW